MEFGVCVLTFNLYNKKNNVYIYFLILVIMSITSSLAIIELSQKKKTL